MAIPPPPGMSKQEKPRPVLPARLKSLELCGSHSAPSGGASRSAAFAAGLRSALPRVQVLRLNFEHCRWPVAPRSVCGSGFACFAFVKQSQKVFSFCLPQAKLKGPVSSASTSFLIGSVTCFLMASAGAALKALGLQQLCWAKCLSAWARTLWLSLKQRQGQHQDVETTTD